MIGSNFEKRVQNVKDFIRIRDETFASGGNFCRITFQLTFIELGLEELPDVIRLASSLGVNRVKGHHLWVFTHEMQNQNLRRNIDSIRRWNEIVAKALDAAEKHRLPGGEKILLENIYPLNESAMEELVSDGVCPFLGEEAWVSSEGRFNPCCAPNEERLKLGEYGNLFDTSIENIWQGTAYQQLRKNYLQHAVCKGCNMRKKQPQDSDAENRLALI
jgi:MoaA/NifB/PqqE/SkfB family radical SAM enzyme